MATGKSTLIIVERAYRGAVETQFADVLYFIRELNRQSGGADLALRGLAVSYALHTGFVPAIRLGERVAPALTDPRQRVRDLLGDGVLIWVEEPDVAALGYRARDRLLPGVRIVPGPLGSLWPGYRRVWFM